MLALTFSGSFSHFYIFTHILLHCLTQPLPHSHIFSLLCSLIYSCTHYPLIIILLFIYLLAHFLLIYSHLLHLFVLHLASVIILLKYPGTHLLTLIYSFIHCFIHLLVSFKQFHSVIYPFSSIYLAKVIHTFNYTVSPFAVYFLHISLAIPSFPPSIHYSFISILIIGFHSIINFHSPTDLLTDLLSFLCICSLLFTQLTAPHTHSFAFFSETPSLSS